MALTVRAIKLLFPYLRNAKILSLGYPDLVIPDCVSLLGIKPEKFNDTGRWHGVGYCLPESVHVFEKLGSTLDCIDIHASRGVERMVDLNLPVDLGDYDLVIDAGTIEHCFNIAQAIINAAQAVNVGGHIFHSPPLTMINHGFYNICPTFFHDFYTQNGFEIEHMSGYTKDKSGPVDPTGRFETFSEASLYCVAKRIIKGPLKFPQQTKYLKNPGLS